MHLGILEQLVDPRAGDLGIDVTLDEQPAEQDPDTEVGERAEGGWRRGEPISDVICVSSAWIRSMTSPSGSSTSGSQTCSSMRRI
ncbi:MAG: hypothetical protein ACRDNE_10950 [Gaiellaceae bacterium]